MTITNTTIAANTIDKIRKSAVDQSPVQRNGEINAVASVVNNEQAPIPDVRDEIVSFANGVSDRDWARGEVDGDVVLDWV